MYNVEVLAPCGNLENLNVAIACGADAVYLGVSEFNARISAENFTTDSLKSVVQKCHFHGVKVYLTLNILIKEEEYSDLKTLVWVAKEAQIDAYIVQDLGVAGLIKEIDSDAVLHASTQMGVHNLQGAKVVEALGFSRVVVSRETTILDIKAIAKGTNLEIESFVQGALCVSFSGGCLLSSVHNGNSGNRGKCQQLCRLPITAISRGKVVKKGYLLSARDLCYAESVQKLVDAGVTSLKIEGRMRSSLYVAEAVTLYKNIVQGIKYDKKGITIAYNRGAYNEGAYFGGKCGNIINPINQNHIGTEIGIVISAKPFKDLYEIVLTSNRALNKGDGLKFFDGTREVASAGVGNIYNNGGTYKIFSKARVREGNRVSIIFDNDKRDAFVKNALLYKEKCNISATINAGAPLQITVESRGVSIVETSDYIVPKAVNKATSTEEIVAQLSKMQDTPFSVGKTAVTADAVFIPKSILNGLRRTALASLEAKIKAEYNRQTSLKEGSKAIKSTSSMAIGNIFAVDSATMVRVVVAHKKGGIIAIKPQNYTRSAINEIVNSCVIDEEKWQFALELPVFATGLDMAQIDSILNENKKIKVLVANNISGLHYLNKGYTVIAGSGLNVISSQSAERLVALGVSAIVASVEHKSNLNATKNITHSYKSGKLSVMTLRHCPFKVVYGGDCTNCKFNKDLKYIIEGREYNVVRTKISACQFTLRSSENFQQDNDNLGYFDL